ncbi:MAG TPA: MgtC/SapB family protein [Bacteroidia bacterium]|nr:MgtC/SapB family protein [Bacteroidia bacterium]
MARILLAAALGGIIGLEREYGGRHFGFRTIILICMGSALFTMLSLLIGRGSDPSRIASNILTGVGFLGAGAIFKEGITIKGMASAALIWVSAAIGMACGMGEYLLAILVTIMVLIILLLFTRIKRIVDKQSELRVYTIGISKNPDLQKEVENKIREFGLSIEPVGYSKSGDMLRLEYDIRGSHSSHEKLLHYLATQQFILEFEA